MPADSIVHNADIAINDVVPSSIEATTIQDDKISAAGTDNDILQQRGWATTQWLKVVGGWTEFQFAERRMPILDEINGAAPDIPIFVLHRYDRSSRRLFTHEFDRFGVTSAIDAGGGFQNYANAVIQEPHKRHKPRRSGLLLASFTCFGIAALFLVALINALS